MEVRNPEYARLSRIYSLRLLQGCFARKTIRPSDIDGLQCGDHSAANMYYVEQDQRFCWFELKTTGERLEYAQERTYTFTSLTCRWKIGASTRLETAHRLV